MDYTYTSNGEIKNEYTNLVRKNLKKSFFEDKECDLKITLKLIFEK